MDMMDRIQKLDRIFSSRRYPVTLQQLCEELQLSKAVVKKAIEALRDWLHAPLEYDTATKGWHYDQEQAKSFQLPGLWLTSAELLGLVATLNIFDTMDAGLLDNDIDQVRSALESLLASRGLSPTDVKRLIKFLPTKRHPMDNHLFAMLADILVDNQQVFIVYENYSGDISRRTVSPQGLIYYQENWYLDAWCHQKNAPRSFRVSRISKANRQAEKRYIMSDAERHAHYASTYGIFAGPSKHEVTLRFSQAAAREAASRQWHPEQIDQWEGEQYLLSFPYGDDRELLRDILHFGADVKVEAPQGLRDKVTQVAAAILAQYTLAACE